MIQSDRSREFELRYKCFINFGIQSGAAFSRCLICISLHTGAIFYSFTDYFAKDSSMHLIIHFTIMVTLQIMIVISNIICMQSWLSGNHGYRG